MRRHGEALGRFTWLLSFPLSGLFARSARGMVLRTIGMTANVGQLTPFDEGVWMDTQPTRIIGMDLTATMTVLRLGAGNLLVHSPISLTPQRRAAVEALGRVAHLYAPNLFHHMHMGEWASAYPSARVHAPADLAKKRPDLRISRTHGEDSHPDIAGFVDELRIDGFRLQESVLLYRPARTLLVADLVHNVGRPRGAWSKFYTKGMGFYDRVALSRMLRWTAFSDPAAASTGCLRCPSSDSSSGMARLFKQARRRVLPTLSVGSRPRELSGASAEQWQAQRARSGHSGRPTRTLKLTWPSVAALLRVHAA